MASLKTCLSVASAAWLGACSAADFTLGGPPTDPGLYATLFPYYVETCAVSELRKKPGFGFEYAGGTGGHSVAYLNGVCTDPGQHFPTLTMCGPGVPAAEAGTGISANSHFANANWVAIPGRAMFFSGDLPAAAALTRSAYQATQAHAKTLDIYDGVRFHDEAFADQPPGWSRADWSYEISIATDYAIDFGRGRYCASVPVDRAQMARVVDYLNGRNAIYRRGPAIYRWDVLEDNCSHLTHNALAAAGVWPEWPTHQPFIAAALDFPVPRNEFVNLVRRTNDLPIDNLDALYADQGVRRAVLARAILPTEPGALASAYPPRRPNAVYDTDLQLIFYDEPVFGPYRSWFAGIFADPRTHDLPADLAHFAATYRTIQAARQPLDRMLSRRWAQSPADRAQFARFYAAYWRIIDRQSAEVTALLARLTPPAAPGAPGALAAAPTAAPTSTDGTRS